MIHPARGAPGRRCIRALACLVALSSGSCGPGESGAAVSYFRFVMDGAEYEVENAELSILPLAEDERYHYMISSSMDGPQVAAMWRMPFTDIAALEALDVTAEQIRDYPSGTFVLGSEGEAGVSLIPESTMLIRFTRIDEGSVVGVFEASDLLYTDSSMPTGRSRLVAASGRFRLPVDVGGR